MTPPIRLVPAVVCLTGLALVAGLTPLSNNDIWIHLTTGRLIVERGAIPSLDEYSFTAKGQPYVTHEWLAQVIFYLVHRAAGLTGLILIKPLVACFTAGIVAWTCVRLRAGPTATFLATALVIVSLSSHLFTRPHLFTFMGLAVIGLIVATPIPGARTGRLAAAAITMALWVNLHGGFVIGLALAVLAGAWWGAAAMIPASMINPHGPALLGFSMVFTDPVFRDRIREWGSPLLAPFLGTFHFWVYAGVLGMALAAVPHHLRRRRPGAAFVLVGFAALSLVSKRNASVLAVVGAPWIALAASECDTARRERECPATTPSPVAVALVGVLALAGGWLGVPHETGDARRVGLGVGPNVPVEALDHVAAAGIEGPVLNSFGAGAYVVYRTFPRSPVTIDSRLDVYGGDFIEAYLEAMSRPEAMRAFLAEYPVDWAILSWSLEEVGGAVEELEADPEWALVYYDDLSLIYSRRRGDGEPFRLTNPWRFLSTGSAPWDAGARTAALAECDRARELAPGARVVRLMRGAALQALGRHEEALAEFDALAPLLRGSDPGVPLLLGLRGTSCMELGRNHEAERTFRELLAIVPESGFARSMLEEARRRR